VSAFARPLEDGETAFHHKDYQTSLKLLQPLAEQGNPQAQYYVGQQYLAAWGIKKDKAEGIKLIQQSADQGYAPAQVEVGKWHRKDVCEGGTPSPSCLVLPQHDDLEAHKWFQK